MAQLDGNIIFRQIRGEAFVETERKWHDRHFRGLESLQYIGFDSDTPLNLAIQSGTNHYSRLQAHLGGLGVDEEGYGIVTSAIEKLIIASSEAMKKIGSGNQITVGMFKNTLQSDYLDIRGMTKLEAKILHRLLFASMET